MLNLLGYNAIISDSEERWAKVKICDKIRATVEGVVVSDSSQGKERKNIQPTVPTVT